MLEWAQAVVTIRVFGEELHLALLPERAGEIDTGDRSVLADTFARACAITGVDQDEMWVAIETDTSLAELTAAMLLEVLSGSPDPGPYDVISRESPSGTPENRHIGAYGAAAVGQPVSLEPMKRT